MSTLMDTEIQEQEATHNQEATGNQAAAEEQAAAEGYVSPAPQRPRNVLVGTSFSVGAVLMYFGGLLGIYLSERADFLKSSSDSSWIPAGTDIQLAAPTVVLWTLFFSIATMQWAVYSTRRNDRRHALMALALTALFGVAVINQMFFIISQMDLAIEGGSRAAPLIYTLLGSYIAALVAALIFLLVAVLRNLSGESTAHNSQIVSSAAVFWDALIFIYFLLWLIIFVTK